MMPRLCLLMLLLAPAAVWAEEDLTVLTEAEEPRKMLYKFLQAEAQKHFEARRAIVAALETPEQIVARQVELREKFWAAIGGQPERTPLNPRVVGTLPGDGFRVEKVIYESRPDHHVTAVLYLPEATGPVPGVLVPCGHSANGKAAEPYQRACILMAKNGLAVLCYDPISQGERGQLLDATGKPVLSASTAEHSLIGIGALLVGGHAAGYRVWDGVRSLDYLASRPEVDPTRLGCTGNSGGGTLTAYLMALDERILAAAPSCYITSLERLFDTIGPQDAEQNITGQVAFGMEHADYVTMRAPRPTLICIGTQDYFDAQGAWTTFREAKLIYGKLGHAERVDLFEFNDPHGFSLPRRQASMRWMRRWLLQKDDAPTEADFPIFTDAELQCTRTGQVMDDLRGRSTFDLNASQATELAKARPARRLREGEWRVAIWQRLNLPAALPTVQESERGTLTRGELQIRKLLLTTEPGITLPAIQFQAEGAAENAPYTIYLHDEGKAADAAPGGPIEQLAKSGRVVLAVDLRGLGETAPNTNKPGTFGPDAREAFLALHLNRPLLGQRVLDLLVIVAAARQPKPREVEVIARGSLGSVALHTAALEPHIERVTLVQSIASWEDVVRTPQSVNQLTNVVPGVLTDYDLLDLPALIAPRFLTLREPLDAAGKPLSAEAVQAISAEIQKVYGAQAEERLKIEVP